MDHRYLYDVSNIVGTLRNALEPCQHSDRMTLTFSELVDRVLAVVLLNDNAGSSVVVSEMVKAGLDEDTAKETLHFIMWRLARGITTDISTRYNPDESDVFFKVNEDDSLTVVVSSKAVKDAFDVQRQEILEGIANGDYYPEHIRRMVGAQ